MKSNHEISFCSFFTLSIDILQYIYIYNIIFQVNTFSLFLFWICFTLYADYNNGGGSGSGSGSAVLCAFNY